MHMELHDSGSPSTQSSLADELERGDLPEEPRRGRIREIVTRSRHVERSPLRADRAQEGARTPRPRALDGATAAIPEGRLDVVAPRLVANSPT